MISQSALVEARHIVITASLVRECGGMNEAAVASLIAWKTEPDAPYAVAGNDGQWWWAASADLLSEWTGLSPDQVRRALRSLIEAGHVERRKLHAGGASDHTYSYRLVRQFDVAQSPDQDVAQSPDLPYTSPLQDNPPTPQSGEVETTFEQLWLAWPKKTEKKTARERWVRLSSAKRAEVLPTLLAHAAHYAVKPDQTYTPNLASYIHRERWTDQIEMAPGVSKLRTPVAGDPPAYRGGSVIVPRGLVLVRHSITAEPLGYQAEGDPRPTMRLTLNDNPEGTQP